jgi:HEAT repeat protein
MSLFGLFQKTEFTREDVSELEREGDLNGLIKALSYKGNMWVRWDAVRALAALGNTRAVKPLIAALKKDRDVSVRGEAALALGKLGDERAIGPLVAALEDKGQPVRTAAVWALAQIGKPAVKPLTAALKNHNQWTRISAAGALGAIGDMQAVKPLIAALDDESFVAWPVAHALRAITGQSFGLNISQWQQWWQEQQ